jgi:hypothetical protein
MHRGHDYWKGEKHWFRGNISFCEFKTFLRKMELLIALQNRCSSHEIFPCLCKSALNFIHNASIKF